METRFSLGQQMIHSCKGILNAGPVFIKFGAKRIPIANTLIEITTIVYACLNLDACNLQYL